MSLSIPRVRDYGSAPRLFLDNAGVSESGNLQFKKKCSMCDTKTVNHHKECTQCGANDYVEIVKQ